VDLGAIRANVTELRRRVAPAAVLAVVKADAYGHGAVPVARAALEAGAERLGVAIVEEGVTLRAAGIEAPILLLSEPPADVAAAVVEHGLTATVYTAAGIDALGAAAAAADTVVPVHLKVDTGMHRVGCAPDDAVPLARRIAEHPHLDLEGVFTHLAVADEPDNPYTAEQLATFDDVLAALDAAGLRPRIVHAANSAGALVVPGARFDLVRVGITIYGIPPAGALAPIDGLVPALRLTSAVTYVKRVPAGARLSYGLRYAPRVETTIVTVPIGYADGVPRRLGHVGGEVLIGGRRCPIAGTITMDQLLVDVGDAAVAVGDEVVLLGRQGDEEITATEWADRLDTIAYEIVCGIGPRVPREYT
jgi:alanine racemase